MQRNPDSVNPTAGGSALKPSRVMAWDPASGWTVQRVDPDEIKRRRLEASTVTACTLAGDRHRKRPAEPDAAAAGPSKRQRAMEPPRTTAAARAQGKKPHRRRPQLATHVPEPIGATAPNATNNSAGKDTNRANKYKNETTTEVATVTTARRRPLAVAIAPVSSLPLREPACRRPFAQAPLRLWRRVRTLGCGTFGCVREVVHPKTGERAAIKEMGLLPNDYRGSRDGALGDAFRPGISPPSIHMAFRELAAVAALSGHPSVAPVRDAHLAVPRAGVSAGTGIECALLMDLMDGHLGRVVRFLAGQGDARSRSARAAPSFDSALPSSLFSTETSSTASTTTSSTTIMTTTTIAPSSSSATLSSSSLVSSLFSSTGPLRPSISHSSSSTSTPSAPSPALGSPPGTHNTSPTLRTGGQNAEVHSVAPLSPSATSHKSAACPFALRVHVARLVARDILPALVFMHERLGMAHRDIKPNNILYSGDVASGALRFRLADFGLARFVREPRRDAPRRRTKRRRRDDDDSDRPQTHAEPGDTSTPMPSLPSRVSTAVTATVGDKALDKDTAGGVAPKRRAKHAGANTHAKDDNGKDSNGKHTGCDANGRDVHNDKDNNNKKHKSRTGPRLGPCFTANVVTHLYKPPELLLHYATRRAAEHGLAYGCAVDMWSFGVVLMEVLAGGHLTPSEPEETLVKRVRAVFRLDGPPRPHLVRDLVRAVEARAATGRSGVGSIPRVPTQTTPSSASDNNINNGSGNNNNDNDNGFKGGAQGPCSVTTHEDVKGCASSRSSASCYDDLIDLVERLLCVDPLKRMTASQAACHPFVVGDSGDSTNGLVAYATVGAPTPLPRFLGVCDYKALGAGSCRAAERARAGDPTLAACTLAARKVAVARACAFADRYDLKPHTVACAIAMLDHYLERAPSCNDEALLLMSAGALLVACSLYECRWPAYDQFVSLGVVPPAWYGVDRRAPSAAVRTPAPDAVLRAAVDLFNALDHLTPHVDTVAPLVDGSLAIGCERKDTSPWRAMTATFSRYPPLLTLSR
ncbi:Ser/thr kinase [Pandoravirus kuranda]|uniref:Ser/thr kinase n=1 Tax=Pandoravirus kuranda TaxID=3019033 RepID=A0AA95EEQ4_9VIRU|nr:Ser/thr kinase [Pandoravirus kuranda]